MLPISLFFSVLALIVLLREIIKELNSPLDTEKEEEKSALQIKLEEERRYNNYFYYGYLFLMLIPVVNLFVAPAMIAILVLLYLSIGIYHLYRLFRSSIVKNKLKFINIKYGPRKVFSNIRDRSAKISSTKN